MGHNLPQGLIHLEGHTLTDTRGYFRETWRESRLADVLGRKIKFIQGNESLSLKAGVIRGFHFQKSPFPQAKLVRVNWGAIYDVAVDLRYESPTFGQWWGFELSAENGNSLFIGEGFAHGFCTLLENTVVSYQVTNYYAPECDAGIKWNDPKLNINWLLPPGGAIISSKDETLPCLSDLTPEELKLFFLKVLI